MPQQHIHIVARCLYPYEPFKNRIHCIWMWKMLQRLYPSTHAAILMPNHLHLVTESEDINEERRKLSKLIAHFTRVFYPGKILWQPVGEVELIPDLLYLQRTIRYVHLNPARKKLVDDPLKWEFSTHRDWLGLSYPSWISQAKSKSVFRSFSPESFHSYISSDPSCHVAGTPLPQVLKQSKSIADNQPIHLNYSEIPLPWIFRSVIISHHAPVQDLYRRSTVRRLVVQIASEHQAFYPSMLGAQLKISRQAIHWLLQKRKNNESILAAKLSLSDPRLFNVSVETLQNDKLLVSGLNLRNFI